ncbi:MAG TPA: carboxypeptidase regulatory-like domain-containing protein, partial [Candidatus Tumulicola sp.]
MKRISLPHFAAAGSKARAMTGGQATWTLTAGRAIRAIPTVEKLANNAKSHASSFDGACTNISGRARLIKAPRGLYHAAVAALLLVAFLLQGTWAQAGVTGNIAGVVRDSAGAPVAGAQVRAVSPSQAGSTTTDSGGHFILLSLSPDTYTITVSKGGYGPTSAPGQVVFADQTQQVTLMLQKQLQSIAHVTSTATGSLVKSGVGGDLYSVNAAQITSSASATGGGNLNTAYSAIATVPGLYVGAFGSGWNQGVVVRGQNPWTTGFEYDGIPVNRS